MKESTLLLLDKSIANNRFNTDTKPILVELIRKYGRLPEEIALQIIEFLPLEVSFTKFNPACYDQWYSLIELILIIINNIIHYGIICYLCIWRGDLWLRFIFIAPLTQSLIIIYLYYSNIKFIKVDAKYALNVCAFNVFGKLYSILEIFCYLPMIIFLIVIHQTKIVQNDTAIYLILIYFGGYIIMKLYQNVPIYRIQTYRFILKQDNNLYFMICTRYYLLFECWLLLIYGIIIKSLIILIMATIAFYIGLICICKTLSNHWWNDKYPKYIMIIYIENICFGIFSMQVLFTNGYPNGFIIICIITTILQSIHCVGRHLLIIDQFIPARYLILYLLPDVLMTVFILNLSLYVVYDDDNDNKWRIIWYINLIVVIMVILIKDTYVWKVGNLDNKSLLELNTNLIEHGIYTLIFGIWGIVYLESYPIDKSQFLSVFASISTGIGSIGLCCMICCVYIVVQELNKPPGMYPYGTCLELS